MNRLGSNRRGLLVFDMPRIPFVSERKREIGVYTSGALFAAGWWMFLQACILSSKAAPPPDAPHDTFPVHVRFSDWVPGLLGTTGMIIVNLLDKSRLSVEDVDARTAWRARTLLFLGFAMMAGGLAGSITILLIKYVLPDYAEKQVVFWGLSNVIQNVCIMLSASILWLVQNDEDTYNIAL